MTENERSRWKIRTSLVVILSIVAAALASPAGANATAESTRTHAASEAANAAAAIIPRPQSIVIGQESVSVDSGAVIKVASGDSQAATEAAKLASALRLSTGYAFPISPNGAPTGSVTISLSSGGASDLGKEGYSLDVGGSSIALTAATGAGLYRGITTLLQLFPSQVIAGVPLSGVPSVKSVQIKDSPRYAFRASLLDVGRRFYPVSDIERYLDQMAKYKLNVLQLHLTDDQGWRFPVADYPELTRTGASTQSGWRPENGGPWFYTKKDLKRIIAYAKERHIEVIPEIDGPGHSTAAKASIPSINCDGRAPAAYSGLDVGLPPICLSSEKRSAVAAYLKSVFTAVAAYSSSEYVHIGGDEVPGTTAEQMDWYVRTASAAVTATGKKVMGWSQIGSGTLPANSVVQWWGTEGDRTSIGTNAEAATVVETRDAVAQGASVVVSPADHAYIDMKYDSSTPYGLKWAGYVNLRAAYDWDPTSALSSPDGSAALASGSSILGVSAALWADRAYSGSTSAPSSTAAYPTPRDYTDFMAFPRMPAIAEVGWSSREGKSYDDFARRVVAHSSWWKLAGIKFNSASDIAWSPTSAFQSQILNGGYALDSPRNTTATGAALETWDRHSGTNQLWKFTRVADDTYTIANVGDGFCLDVPGSSVDAGVSIIRWTCTGTSNQRWKVDRHADGYTITSVSSGLRLTQFAAQNASKVTQEASASSAAQLWSIPELRTRD